MIRTLDKQLIDAARSGNLEVVRSALLSGADVHASNDTAFLYAAANNHLSVVYFLLKSGADIHADGDGALRWAAENGHTDVVGLLLKAGADAHTFKDYALRYAAENGHSAVVELLLKSGADVHAANDEALRWAARNGHNYVVNILIQHRSDLTALRKVLNKKELSAILKQYAATAFRGVEAVMLLDEESRMDVLRHLRPELKPKQIREELAMFEALGLDAAQMAAMWKEQHGSSTRLQDAEVAP